MTSLNMPSLERSIAITEITHILNRYCILARENAPFTEMAELFVQSNNEGTGGGVFCLPNDDRVRPQDMEKVVQGKPPSFIRHHLTSVDIEFVSDTEAKTKALFFAMTDLANSRIDHWGYWRDVFRKEEGKWLVGVREIVVEGADDEGWYAGTYGKF